MTSPLELQAAGKKRPFSIEREMMKCEPCRQKRIKCLPTRRDWSKGEKCSACERKKDKCGPNIRANRLSRPPNHAQVSPPAEQPLSPSKFLQLPPGPPSEHTKAAQPVEAAASELENGTRQGSLRMSTGANFRTFHTEAQQDDFPGHRNSMASSFLQLGDLRMTLQNVKRRLDAIVSSDFGASHSSTTSKCEAALDMLANNLQVEFTNVLENVMILLDGLDPGPYKELALRRTLRFIETFAELADVPFKLDNTPSTRIRKCHYTVLSMLISTYEAQADFPEAEHFTQQLTALPWEMNSINSETTNRLAKSLARTSRRMRDVLKSLVVPAKYSSALHVTDADPFPPLHRAMLDRNEKVIRSLCETTESVLEQEDILRRGVLHLAAETSNMEILGRFTGQTQGLMKSRDLCLTTPLCLAAYYGDYEFFAKMVELCDPLDLEVKDGESQSVMTIACAAGHTRIVEFLLANKISPNDNVLTHCSPLDAAASAGHSDICRSLLDHGAWVDWFNFHNKTAAQCAEQNGHHQIAIMIGEYRYRPQNLWTWHLQQTHPSSLAPTVESSPISLPRPFTPLQSTLGVSPSSPSYYQSSTSPDEHETCSTSPEIQIYVVDDPSWESQHIVDPRGTSPTLCIT